MNSGGEIDKKNGTETVCVESLPWFSWLFISILWFWAVVSSVHRFVLTSWSTAKLCCCRAQLRLSSVSASLARQAVSQLAGTEVAQVSDTLPKLKKRKKNVCQDSIYCTSKLYFLLLYSITPFECLKSDISSQKSRISRGSLSLYHKLAFYL